MWDSFKQILGINAPTVFNRPRFENAHDTHNNNNWEYNYDDLSDDESNVPMPNHHFFSIFTNPIEMHKFFERQMDEVVKRAFQFNSEIGWDGFEESSQTSGNLRDEFLKPGITKKLEKDDDLDGRIGTREFQSFLDGRQKPRQIQPSVYSRSVVVQTIRRPDGTIETTRTERDHTGHEKTTITTQGGSSQSDNLPIAFNEIFSKLISF